MKLVLAIVSGDDANKVSSALIKQNFFVTNIASTGGFLRDKSSTFLIGTDDKNIPEVLEIIKKYSKTRNKPIPKSVIREFKMFENLPGEVKMGGATVFVIDVDQFIKL